MTASFIAQDTQRFVREKHQEYGYNPYDTAWEFAECHETAVELATYDSLLEETERMRFERALGSVTF